MNELVLSRTQARAVDQIAIQEYGVPGIVLMENAGRGMCEILTQQSPTGLIVVLCGTGNNAGDGFVIARHLENRGFSVEVVTLSDRSKLSGDALTNFQILQKSGTKIDAIDVENEMDRLILLLERSEWIVDALLGSGIQGRAREPYLTTIGIVNGAVRKVLSVDIPSGFDCDLGPIEDATIHATITATCVAMKKGLLVERASDYVGKVEIIDIGIPRRISSDFQESNVSKLAQ